ncbi:MAG: hypothetical protein BWX70_02881 [Verrucomicrobia bacterium ADurb.Bin070]|nr:MAG: hypothetical protein BWX70_02881 [Verrucomicrobia bacterium ADurb.Bin070]
MISAISSTPAESASSTITWMTGLATPSGVTTGSKVLGTALVYGNMRVPSPATGITALRTETGRVMSSSKQGMPYAFWR